MSEAYNEYLFNHISNVIYGYNWLESNLPELIPVGTNVSLGTHDDSKYSKEEYDAYDQYFYGDSEDPDVKEAFDIAWLHHIHNNPHHWQHWVLFEDEGGVNKPKALKMPYNYILEMICDWWSFSWKAGNLYEIFNWYDDHKRKMLLHPETKKTVENILEALHDKLIELDK